MNKLDMMKDVLNWEEEDMKARTTDQLRDLLGCFRHGVRIVEKELNQREETHI